MRVQWKLGAAIAAAVLVVSTSANAQTRGATRSTARSGQSRLLEFGLDGTMAFGMGDVKQTVVGLPLNQFRVGFYMNDQLSIEPSASINYSKASAGGASVSTNTIDLGVSALWHLSTDRSQNQWYVRPGIDILHTGSSDSFGGTSTSDSNNQFALGAAFGLKMPLMSRMATRLEVGLQHRMKSDPIPAQTFLGVSAGFSFFTR